MLYRARDQRFDFGLARDVAGDDMGVAAAFTDSIGSGLAGIRLAAGDHHLGAELRQQFRRATADAAARAGDNGDLAGEIERGGLHWSLRNEYRYPEEPRACVASRRIEAGAPVAHPSRLAEDGERLRMTGSSTPARPAR